MRILSMTATFGKLEHETLTLQPGLNVIEAPNEWGKSTWCAFVVAMLYGISTSSQRKKGFLPDKERYEPWSGRPMAGRMDICWQGKNITLERSAKGKIPFGNFRAYETDTDVPVQELTAENCGQLLLGVEREVFTRAGFLRGSDLPVVEGEALRRRLNALVTTGDESGASDDLAKKLKDLKNKCQHNKTGLIPQAQAQRDQLREKLEQLDLLQERSIQLVQQQARLQSYAQQLENHRMALAHSRSLETQTHLDKANAALEQAKQVLDALEAQCQALPDSQTAQLELERLQQIQQQLLHLQEQEDALPPLPQKPQAPAVFADKDPKQALQQAESDSSAYRMLCKPVTPLLLILAALLLVAAVGTVFVFWQVSPILLVLGGGLVGLYLRNKKAQTRDREAIAGHYGNQDPDSWVTRAQRYAEAMDQYEGALAQRQARETALDGQRAALNQTLELLTGGKRLSQTLEHWKLVLQQQTQRAEAAQRYANALTHAQTVSALVQVAPPAPEPDTLTLTQEQTARELEQTRLELQQVHTQAARCQAQTEALGDGTAITQVLQQVQERLQKLEDIYAATCLAQETLAQAATELQRRFAPRISARARELFSQLTGGRYERLLLASDLSMEVAATDEDTPHGVLWRSDGTADQLYLALRLAVAEELTAEAPLVLDDAFVRFDDTRLAAAMEILKAYSNQKQVILFTCQNREKQYK